MATILEEPGTDRRIASLAAEAPGDVVHSHHYNTALHRAVLDNEKIDGRGILERAAAEVAYQRVFEHLARRRKVDEPAQLRAVDEVFRAAGLGSLNLSGVSREGGAVVASASHHAIGWHLKLGRADRPVCVQVGGFLSGALTAVFGRSYEVVETHCAAVKGAECRFAVRLAKEPVDLSPQVLYPLPRRVPVPEHTQGTPVDEAAAADAVLPPLAVAEDGTMQGLGGYLTRFGAEYYNKVSFRYEREVPRALGSKYTNLPSIVLTEAGHQCGFHTLGGLTKGEGWLRDVAPRLINREDWLYALLGVVNRLGWGAWRVESLVPGERLTLRVYDSYEGLGYRLHNGRADKPRCYHARGVAAALMNLVYVGDFSSSPALTPSYYNQLFRSPLSYRALETRCRAFDDPFCEFVVNPMSPSLGSLQLGP